MRSFADMMTKSPDITTWLKQVDRVRFRDALSLSDQLITRAISDGAMPAAWYFDVRDWCVANKIDVPEHLFKRRKVVGRTKQNAN